MKTRIIVSIILAVGFMSCSNESSQDINGNKVIETDHQICKRVSKQEFSNYLNNNTIFQLVDVRTPDEFNEGNIDGSINIDFRDDDFENKILTLDKSIPTLIYCQAGGRSAKALNKMRDLDFEYVLELEGGYGTYE